MPDVACSGLQRVVMISMVVMLPEVVSWRSVFSRGTVRPLSDWLSSRFVLPSCVLAVSLNADATRLPLKSVTNCVVWFWANARAHEIESAHSILTISG